MIINIGKDFSLNPAGRSVELDGDDSGEAFREGHLKPSLATLKSGEQIEIILDDGVISYGSSFISEAFGALVRDGHISASELTSKLKLTYASTSSYMKFIENRIYETIENSSSPKQAR